MHMPKDESQMTMGFAFIQLPSEEDAKRAVAATDKWQLTKKNVFAVNLYTELERYRALPDVYVAPAARQQSVQTNLTAWLSDPAARDQFVLRHADQTEVFWSEGAGLPVLDYGGEREQAAGKVWCDGMVQWSPCGTYLATFHRQGIGLWGGDKWARIERFAHSGVYKIDFSPCEKYLVTWNGNTGEKDGNAIVVWEIRSGKLSRAFAATSDLWPQFKWSPDDKFFARQEVDAIAIYETPSMKLLGKQKLVARGLRHFVWSPRQNLIAYWCPELPPNVPANVTVVNIPDRAILSQKNLVSVSDCQLFWQAQGEFLCAQVTRHTKTKKTQFTNFELFRVVEKDIPVEHLELKERVLAFAWEPNGTRFAVIHGDGTQRFNVSFYTMSAKAGGVAKMELLYKIGERQCNKLYWSPLGNALLMAGLDQINGQLEFWDTDQQATLSTAEHFMCNEIQWDPSGRVCCTAVCQPLHGGSSMRYSLENGYTLWSFQGMLLHKVSKQNFYLFQWRPRPALLLDGPEHRNVVKNLKRYIQSYEAADKQRERETQRKYHQNRVAQIIAFREAMTARRAVAAAWAAERSRRAWMQLTESELETVTDVSQVILDRTETIF
jgi:translation initiation factor 3 subunit B